MKHRIKLRGHLHDHLFFVIVVVETVGVFAVDLPGKIIFLEISVETLAIHFWNMGIG